MLRAAARAGGRGGRAGAGRAARRGAGARRAASSGAGGRRFSARPGGPAAAAAAAAAAAVAAAAAWWWASREDGAGENALERRQRRRRERDLGTPAGAVSAVLAAEARLRTAEEPAEAAGELSAALRALARLAERGGDDGAAAAEEVLARGAVPAMARVALHAEGVPPAALAELAAAVDALCRADERVYAAVLGEGGVAMLVGFLARYRDVTLRLFSAAALRRHLPPEEGARPPPPGDDPAGMDATRASRELVDLLLALVHDHSDVDESTTGVDVGAVRRAWSADDASGGTSLLAIESLLEVLKRLQDDSLHYHGVRALATLSELPANRKAVVRGGGVALLHALYAAHREESRLCVQAARALANLACSPEGARAIVTGGFLLPLVCWARGEADDESPFTYFHELRPKVKLRLQALRAIHNMGSSLLGRGPQLADEVYPLAPLLRRVPAPAGSPAGAEAGGEAAPAPAPAIPNDSGVDVVFVHGILGNPLSTWRLADNADEDAVSKTVSPWRAPRPVAACTVAAEAATGPPAVEAAAPAGGGPDEAEAPPMRRVVASMEQMAPVADEQAPESGRRRSRKVVWPLDWLGPDLPGTRVLSVGYRSVLTTWTGATRDLRSRAKRLARQLRRAGVGRDGRRVVFVTHSMGGLLVKQMLADEPQMRDATAGAVFYATPHSGSQWPSLATYAGVAFRPTEELIELGNFEALAALNERYLALGVPTLSFGEAEPTPIPPSMPNSPVRVVVVASDSANPGCGEFHMADANHLSVCKPRSRSDPIYARLVGFIREVTRAGRGE